MVVGPANKKEHREQGHDEDKDMTVLFHLGYQFIINRNISF